MRDVPDLQGRETDVLAILGVPWADSIRHHIRCPFHDHEDKHPSWRWALDHRRFYCSCGRTSFGDGKKGGDIYDVIIRMGKAADFVGARKWALEALNIAPQKLLPRPGAGQAQPSSVQKSQIPPVMDVCSGYQRAKRKPALSQLTYKGWGKPARIRIYHDPATREIAEVRARYEGPLLDAAGLRKEVVPWTLIGDRWMAKQMPGKRPFLNALEIEERDAAPILVVEGEWDKYDRARQLFPDYVVTSGSGGANGTAGMDYSLLRGRRVIVWPDNDGPGMIYADGICGRAIEAGAAEARIVDVPRDWPPAWDLGEEPPPDSIDLRDMLDCANPWTPTPASAQNGALLNGHANGVDHGPLLNGHAAPAKTAPASKFKLTRLRDIAPVLSGMWLIKGLLPARGLCTVFGEPGCGKSFLTLDMVLHVAAGIDYAGRRTKPARVIYIAAEGQGGFRNRVIEAAKAIGLDDTAQFDLIEVAPNLGAKGGDAAELIAAIEAQSEPGDLPVGVIVIDTTSQTMGGENENNEGMATFIINANTISSHFACLSIAIHHVGKADTATPRGWSGLHGANDAEIKVSGLENPHTAQVVKQKDGDTGEAFSFNLHRVELGQDEDGDAISTCIVEKLGSLAKIEAARKEPGAKAARRSIREFDAAFNEAMMAAGEEYRIEGDGPSVQAVYVHQIRPYFAKRWATDEPDKQKRTRKAAEAFRTVLKSLPPKYHTRDATGGERIWRGL